ncbi:MAG: hypothetical protein ACI9VR_002369 [Cognaticolwellia sp.]|jgi:hypothetical protein
MLALMLLSQSANAFEVMEKDSGAAMRWSSFPVNWSVNANNNASLDPNTAAVVVQRAAEAWEIDGTAVKLSYTGTTGAETSGHNGQPAVYFVDQDWPWDASLLAMTSSYSDASGAFVGFDIAVNTQDHGWALDGNADLIDLQNTLTHEWGHVLGLGHSDNDLMATMHASASPGEVHKRDLAQDDVDGLFSLYAGNVEVPNVGCNTVSSSPKALAWLSVLATILLINRRRARS